MQKYSIGLDFGTESARAVLVDVGTGETVASDVQLYTDGVVEKTLPGSKALLPLDWALQNPADWLSSMEIAVSNTLKKSGLQPTSVAGIGIDFTSCTILPVNMDGTPLCNLNPFKDRPHAWAKLWKHHAAAPQAARISRLAAERGESWLPRYGGFISSEWVMPKALQILEEDLPCIQAANFIVEGGDWIAWQLTGNLGRNPAQPDIRARGTRQTGSRRKIFY